ncbi:RHS repeat-associated core domain-containing protein [Massilia sp. W12]|uniref:RHS repeat domain-containing protein n=1 Tax=Massilia sp. W12 TaxID=3126507 RepID=UPI0030CBFE26
MPLMERGTVNWFSGLGWMRLRVLCGRLSHKTSFAYDKVGNLIKQTDARSKDWHSKYDGMRRLVQRINAVNGVSSSRYWHTGLGQEEEDEDGRKQHYLYDNYLRLIQETDDLKHQTEYSYYLNSDPGQGPVYTPLEIKYPGYSKSQRFDARERLTSETIKQGDNLQSSSHTSSRSYDKRGLLLTETDPYQKTSQRSYDGLGQMTVYEDRLKGKTMLSYDARGNLLQVEDARGKQYRYEYDRNDKVVKEIRPLGQEIAYVWDAAGRLQSRTDPLRNKVQYSWDAVGRLRQVEHISAAGELRRSITFSYDEVGNLLQWQEQDHARQQSSQAQMTYDDANRKLTETLRWPNQVSQGYEYAYSKGGKKTALIWPDGTRIAYDYSKHGRLQSVQIPGEGSLSVNAWNWLMPAKTTLPGGSVQEAQYDGVLNLRGLQLKNPAQQNVLSLENRYGKAFELTQRSRSQAEGSWQESFQYDHEQRLTQAARSGSLGEETQSFTLDGVANRTQHSRTDGAWEYDANNRLLRRGSGANATRYDWDDNGALQRRSEGGNQVQQYIHDEENRLSEVRDGAGKLIARYGYDPMHRRIWKEQFRDRQGAALTQALRTLYLYNDEGLLAESTQPINLQADGSAVSTGEVQIQAQYGAEPGTMFGTSYQFAKLKAGNGESKFVYLQNDHLGAPILATDKEGTVQWSMRADVFGMENQVWTDAGQGVKLNLRFPGQYADEETGFFYNWHRYYDPGVGRYIQSDPIGVYKSIYNSIIDDVFFLLDPFGKIDEEHYLNHLYVYASGNSLGMIDVFGLYGEHTKNARKSTLQKHQQGQTRKQKDAGGEKGDKSRSNPRKPPSNHKGPWPPKNQGFIEEGVCMRLGLFLSLIVIPLNAGQCEDRCKCGEMCLEEK